MAGGPKTSPPSYEESCIKPSPGTCPLLQQPGPGNPYREIAVQRSMLFGFCPDPSDLTMNQDWAAVLMVKCHNVPGLMREGFHWDDVNVIKEEGYVDRDFTHARRRKDGKCWAGTRHYFLKDLQQPLRWVATIQVWALNLETLHQFDLNQLSRERSMQWATAFYPSGQYIFNWHYCSPAIRFNAICNDMPMEAWLQWPRKN
ncbi:hypothetical protein F4679DRAFT_582996 [Xylaria curta]|nr:hypothetical protein F4679DRAFT_582996 [Xylaria curta]